MKHFEENIASDFCRGNTPSQHQMNLFMRKYSITSLLPYEQYDESSGIFINKNSVGFVLDMHPLTGGSGEISTIISALLADELPTSIDLQILLFATPKISKYLENWRGGYKNNSISDSLVSRRIHYFERLAFEPLSEAYPVIARDFQLIISVSCTKKNVLSQQIEQLIKLQAQMLTTLKNIGMAGGNISINRFLNVVYEFLYPEKSTTSNNLEWSPYDILSEQLSNGLCAHFIDSEQIKIINDQEEWFVKSLTVQQYPQDGWALWGNSNLIGELFREMFQFSTPFCLNFSIHIPEQESTMSRAIIKSARAGQLARSPLAKLIPGADKTYKEWEFVKSRLGANDRLVKTFFQVLLYGQGTKINEVERKAKDLFRSKGWVLKKERFLQYQSWLAALPMMFSEGIRSDLQRFGKLKTLPGKSAAQLFPIFAEWKGVSNPSLLLIGRRGQVFFWDNFNDSGELNSNYNVCIVAAPGAGKSVMVNEKVMLDIRAGGRVWIIDIGYSYKKMTKLLQGEFIEFGSDNRIILNPFSYVESIDESLDMLKPLFALMVRPNTITSDEENTYLEKAITTAWDKNKKDTSVSDIAEELLISRNEIAKNLGHLLYPFTKKGMYGRYFEGEANIDLSNPLVVLELEELKGKKHLQKVILWVLMQQITEVMYLTDRSIRKSVIIDEAWELMGGENKNAQIFIEAICRRARKYGGCLITITQSTLDYFSNSAAQAAWKLSDWRIFLKQNPDSIDAMRDNKDIAMDVSMERLLKDLKRTDYFSEMLIYGHGRYAVGRLVLDPFSKILYSTKGDEVEKVNRLMNSGMCLEKAIEEVANVN